MKLIYVIKKVSLILFVFGLFIPLIASGQDAIKGKITDSKGIPLPGVSVLIKETKLGTTSDVNGNYSINARVGQTLKFSFLGFKNQEIVLKNTAPLNVVLEDDAKNLNEVVVTALGIKKEAKTIGYAVQEVKGADLVKARDQNPITGLTGKIAGLSVGPSAELLRKPTVLLRGNEISLYVVDGIPISSDTWNISPDDIDSYTVLKGPAAAALYGSRAQNGAILITTKKGTTGKNGFTVEFNSTNSIDKGFLAFPRTQDLYGGGENTFYTFVNGKGGAPGGVDGDYDVWGPYFNGQLIAQYDSPIDPITGKRIPTPYIARGKDNLKNFLRAGFQTTNNLSLSINQDNLNMRFSASQSYQQAIIPNNDLSISNFNMYGSYKASPKFKIEANLNYNRQYTDNFPDVDYGPNSLIYNIAVWTGADWDINAPDIKAVWAPGQVGVQSVFAEYQRYHNPYLMTQYWTRGHYKNDIYGYISGNYTFNNHLNATLRTQATTYDLLRNEKMPFSAHPYGREGNQGDYREDNRHLFENNNELLVNYNYKVAKFLDLSGLVGGNIRNFRYNSIFTTTDYLNVPGVYNFGNSLNPVQASSFASQMRVLSAYYSVDLGFGKYATLSSTGRVDKSSAFQTPTSYFYPSVSASTVLSDYIKTPKAISFLKLRGSFAAVRTDDTYSTIGAAPFNSITQLGGRPSGLSLYDNPLGYGNNYTSPYGGPGYSLTPVYSTSKPYDSKTAAYYSDKLYAQDLKTSNRISFEEGIDVKFLNNRLGFSGTAFQYIDGPRVLSNSISTATGYNTLVLNALKTKKTGLELTLNGTPFQNSNGFKWDVLVNWSKFKDVYQELPSGQNTYNTFFHKGDRIDKFYTSAFARTPDGQIINDAAGKPLTLPIAQYLGNYNADFAWAINNSFTYKNLNLSFQFDGSVGGVTTDYMHNKTMRGGRNIETVEGALGAARYADWQNFGQSGYGGSYVGGGVIVSNGVKINYDPVTGAITNYDALKFAANTSKVFVQDYVSKFYNVSEANLMSKTFAKLREVTFTYSLPRKLLQKTPISKASLSLVGRNLLYFYKDKRFKDVDLDQYNYSTGSTALQTPTLRRYGVNLNITF
ncbi:MAG: SusC/RagA family TonB-linked outer membrane protein [Bacteroidetes bacterium]|nr:SusC/RagA family TonB-linked outer membrane protein [Bacteroidota bacterium]MBU1372622.1 SusC/RagA family TonB-linked outer membrane protein [Bacteroidota bacterium]MBU1484818.1 SusC/RagA family TonB-linked outer membrane protein [Bacteroidota bacterium]MBU1759971.1 SusC/RagA family TonB-linked outer membrane protein [Bacteroidota bacterium]MBU2267750.1 SusC/RagA family TonB-linked outer membrane protein [Bacteroidota bacterium]